MKKNIQTNSLLLLTDKEIVYKLARVIQNKRIEADIPQSTFADRVGVGSSTIGAFESGSNFNISISSIIAMLRELKLLDHLEELLNLPLIEKRRTSKSSNKGSKE